MPKQKTDRDTILRESMRVFLQKGYYHTNLSDLGAACGLEKPHFYYYFKNKEDLMREVLEFTYRNAKQHIFDKAYDQRFTPRQRLEKMMQNALRLYAQVDRGCLMGNTVLGTAGSEPAFQDVLRRYFDGWVTSLQCVFGEVHGSQKARLLAQESIQEIQGSVMFVRLYDEVHYLKATTDRIILKL